MKQDTICKHRTVKVYVLRKFMTSWSDEMVDMTGYIAFQKIQTLGLLFYWQNVYFLKICNAVWYHIEPDDRIRVSCRNDM